MNLKTETLENYTARARNKLIAVARAGETITYTGLMRATGSPGRGHIGEVLKAVCQGEANNSRPLLGALVVRAGTARPGTGFWETPAARESLGNNTKIDFWEKERQRVYEYWQAAGR